MVVVRIEVRCVVRTYHLPNCGAILCVSSVERPSRFFEAQEKQTELSWRASLAICPVVLKRETENIVLAGRSLEYYYSILG